MIFDSAVSPTSWRLLAPVLSLLALFATSAHAQTDPTVTITAPTNGLTVDFGTNIAFAGTANDTEDGDLTTAINWTSSLDGSIGAGGSFSLSTLSVGVHTITATVQDSEFRQGSDTVSVTINNTLPTVTITAPADDSNFLSGTQIGFRATATDLGDGTLTGDIVWTSSLDGVFGNAGVVNENSLSVGVHTITASVTDSNSGVGSAAITVTVDNRLPTVSITAPSDNSSFNSGTSVSFAGSASDPEDGSLTTSLQWTSSLDGLIGTGASFGTTSLSLGTHTITAVVTDSNGGAGSASVTVTINNNPPTLSITAPADGSTFSFGTSVNFSATASDVEDGSLTGDITWTSNLDGSIGSGGSFSVSTLQVGTHTITAAVTDNNSGQASESISVTISNNAPTVTISTPADGSAFAFGTTINFAASATDPEDGVLTGSIAWNSSRDGSLGTGGSINVSTLSVGSHVVTASVSDSDSVQGSDTVNVTINNTAPTVTITSPADGSAFDFGATVGFVATATDAEDGNLAASINWTSNLDGALGTGGSINVSALSLGIHTISATVTDSDSVQGSDSISVTINNTAPTVTISSPANGSTFDFGISIGFTATATDAEDGNLTASIGWTSSIDGALGSGGSISVSTLSVGSHTISASVADSGLLQGSVSIILTINNTAPTANPQSVVTTEDTAVAITLTGSDAEDDNLTFAIVTGPASGELSGDLDGNELVTYTPNENFNGSDSFTFTVSDGEFTSSAATVSITVREENDPPTAVDDGPIPPISVDEGGTIDGTFNVLDNDIDPDQDPLTATLVTAPANGTVNLNPDGTFVYTHDGSETVSDSFTYEASDGSESDTATVSITINPVNDAPVFIGVVPPGLSTPEDTTLTIAVSALDIEDPDSDPSSFVLTLDPVLPPDANYTLAGPASITPAENFNGDLSVRATVSDGELASAPFLIPVTVTAENDPPVLEAEIGPQTAIENSLFQLDVSDNFSDSDGDTLAFSATGLPASGNISIDSVTGIIFGTPAVQDARDNDPYVVTVAATDPDGTSVSDQFDLTVSALDRANIGLTIGVTPESGLPNDQLTWTFTAANPIGPAPGENVELTGSFFGDGLSVAAGSGTSCSITLQTGRADFLCTIGALPVGSTTSVNFTTTASQATEVVAFGTAAGAQPVPIDPNISDNSAVRAVGVAESFSDGAVQFLGASTIRSIAAGDFDGDGTTDLVVGTAAGQPVQVYLGDDPRESCDCQRDFVSTPLSIPDTGSNNGIAVADFDNDGNLDFVVANGGGQPDAVYRNNGGANFALAALLAPSNGRDVVVGDFNNDGNMDIAIAATSPNPVYFGDGTGGFGAGILLGDADSFGVAAGRFDNDQFADLVFANVGTGSQVWINNDGTGFAPGPALPISGDALAVAAADLNGDNLDDLVFGRIPGDSGTVPANPVMINQGGGVFSTSETLGLSPTNDVLIGDVSDDGVPDLAFVNQSGMHQIWTASGGSFVLHPEQIIDIGARAGVLANLGFADTGDPGGADLALGGALSAGTAVYLNDSAGNLGLGDAVAPVLTLNGAASVDVPSGNAYTDAGATAIDNIDGDITPSIVISNTVNTAVVGSYTVTYNVQDFAGNAAAQVTRTVNVTAAVGRGGGGGGALGIGAVALLAAIWLLLRSRAELRPGRIISTKN